VNTAQQDALIADRRLGWQGVLHMWRVAGKPDDITPCELAFLRLMDASENGWREHERVLLDGELRKAAVTLIAMLRACGTRLTLKAGKMMVGGDHWRTYEPEIRALRDVMCAVLKEE
jgi:hypothetical protein